MLRQAQWQALLLFAAVSSSQAAEPKPGTAPPKTQAAPSAQATPAPGSPAATTTIDGKYIPPPPEPFHGEIGVNARDSKPYWPPTVVPPKDAPNVLLIMTDDVGFGAPSTFGGVIPTPTLDRIASAGLRYTQFHSTALCSPTRAALITGDNHHSVGYGVIAELATGYPGYDSLIGKDTATVGRILKENGYATSWFGKDHNVPSFQASQAGPFDNWPGGMGFDYFYGFVGGDTSQWEPNLFRNTTAIYPYVGQPGWNLITGMADDAIAHVQMLNEVDPKKPFFVYYVPGATHAPHHPTQEWVKKISDQHLFDGGWNKLRDQIFANQKRLGVIPKDAELTPWPDDQLKRWDTLKPDEQKLFIRQVEVYAAYLAYADHEIGRVIQAIDDMGKLNNTIVIYISGDNGSSAEGSPNGTPNEVAAFNGVEVPVDAQLKNFYDAWGTDKTYNHMAVGWTWAFDTPFRWTKQVASHFGGTRQGMAISWPGHIDDPGGVRNQFHHVIDVVPTILEATGVPAPVSVDGVAQRPIEGVSMAYTFKKANATAATHHHVQYFEMFGNRGVYKDGWYANTVPISAPWKLDALPDPDVINAYQWELFDLTKDWTQNHNLAASQPDKLKQMKELFMVEAAKYRVFPLDNSLAVRMVTPRPSVTAGRTVFTYSGGLTGIPMGDAPMLLGTSYTLTANIEVPKSGAEGVIATQGGRFGGWGFYLLKGKPIYVWNLLDLKRVRWEGREALAPGKHTLTFELQYHGLGLATLAFNDKSGIGQSATGILSVDGKQVSTQNMEHTIPTILQWDESFDVGSDTGTPVDDSDYQVPFAFTGKLNKLTVKIDRPKMTPEQERHFMQQSQRENHASE
jgi:arylsulfatase